VCWRWLVDRPVIERWINNWILCLEVNQVIAINSINYHVSQTEVLMSSISLIMRYGWLVDRPVVEWWVPHWILRINLYVQVILRRLLSELYSDWCWLVGDKILQCTSCNVGIKENTKVITIRFLGKFDSNWSWLIGNKILEGTSCDIGIKKNTEVITIILLSKFNSDWSWLIGDKILQCTSGDI